MLTAERRTSAAREALEAEIEDIIAKYDTLDMLHTLDECKFVAVNFDICFRTHLSFNHHGRIELLRAILWQIVQELANTVARLSSQSTTDDSASFQKLELLLNEMKQKLDSFQSVCASYGNLSPAPPRVTASE